MRLDMGCFARLDEGTPNVCRQGGISGANVGKDIELHDPTGPVLVPDTAIARALPVHQKQVGVSQAAPQHGVSHNLAPGLIPIKLAHRGDVGMLDAVYVNVAVHVRSTPPRHVD